MNLKNLKIYFFPEFPPLPSSTADGKGQFNYERIWRWAVLATISVALIPLIILGVWNLFQFRKALKAETLFPISNLVANGKQPLSLFLDERKSALKFIVHDNSYEALADEKRLSRIFDNLGESLGDVVDLGVINSDGIQTEYVGPYKLKGKDYKDERWFKEVVIRGVHVSDVFLGYRDFPHIVIAVKRKLENGDFFILRTTLDTKKFNNIVGTLNLRPTSDVFVINQEGVIQTPSRYHGPVLARFGIELGPISPESQIAELEDTDGRQVIVGYSRLEDTPFTLVVVKQRREMMQSLESFLGQLLAFLLFSVIIILLVIFRISTIMVTGIQEADRKRIKILHEIEHTAKMASIGRLAAGVAHEINNPLAIINEKAGMIMDLCKVSPEFPQKEKVQKMAESILNSVKRGGAVTYRLLGFARHIDVQVEPIDLKTLMEEVLSFLGKEAEFRNITVKLEKDEDVPPLESDRGQLQQVFLNIINNAMAAVADGGEVSIKIWMESPELVNVMIEDNGIGIPKEDLNRIFEPFFSTKGRKGTGLGLSITYGIVQKLGGKIKVQSEVKKGTKLIVTLPIKT